MSEKKFENTSEVTREHLRESLKDAYQRLDRGKLKAFGNFFLKDLGVAEGRLEEHEITEAEFYDEFEELMDQYGIEWQGSDSPYLRPKR